MKKFVVTLFVLVSLAVTMFPITTANASIQTVECSWWGEQVNRRPSQEEYYRQRQQEYYRRQQEEYYRRQQQRRRQQRGY